jgi:amino acid transporter
MSRAEFVDVDRSTDGAPTRGALSIAFRKSLGRLDVPIVILAAMISLDMVGQIATFGGETFTWLIVLGVLWMIPYGLVLAELGSAFPFEGGLYEWCKSAFGRPLAAFASFMYWSINPLWIGGSLAFIATEAWSLNLTSITPGSVWDYLAKFAFIWGTTAITVASLRNSRWILRAGTYLKVFLVVIFLVTALAYGMRNGFDGVGAGAYAPTVLGFFGLVPLLLFSLVGFEVPSQAGEEMKNPQKDVPRGVVNAGVIGLLCYALPVLAVLAVLPAEEITGIGGFIAAVETVFGIYGSAASVLLDLTVLAFIATLAVTGATWALAANRTQAAAAADGSFFPYFAKFDEQRQSPVRLNILVGIVASVFTVAAIAFADGDNAATFGVVLTITISTSLLAYLVMFPAAIALRRTRRDVPRPYRVPGGNAGMAVAAGICTFWVALGAWVAVFPGTLELLLGEAYPFEDIWGVSRLRFEVFALGTLGVLTAVIVVGYLIGRRSQRAHTVRTSVV